MWYILIPIKLSIIGQIKKGHQVFRAILMFLAFTNV